MSSVLWETLTMKVQILPKCHQQRSFPHHLPMKSIALKWWTFVSWETWTVNVQSIVFASVTSKQPFQDYLLFETIKSTQWALSPWRQEQWTCTAKSSQCHWQMAFQNNLLRKLSNQSPHSIASQETLTVNVQSWVPHCHCGMAFSRTSFKWNDHINSKLCLLGDLNNEHIWAESSPVSPKNLFQASF